jgi:UDP-N-acetyl-2-amino-2-deoxyglucuronate dehydrogenase
MRLAIVGCGWIADYVAFFARLNRRIRLVACCDRIQGTAERFAARHRIPRVYTDYAALIDREALDTVYLAVPHDLHLDMLRTAVGAGFHVLVEKPIARTVAEGEEIVRLAGAAPVCVGVNYQYRYDVGCYALALAAQHGVLGQLYFGVCNLPWSREAEYFGQAPWRGQMARAGGGTLLTQGSHGLDILLWAMDSRPQVALGRTAQQKFKQMEVEDLAMGIVELESGALVQVNSSMASRPQQAITIELHGEKGTAVYRDRPFPHVRFRGVRVKRQRPPVWGLHALHRSLEGFRAWVVEGRPYLTPAKAALPVLGATEAIYRSAKSGRQEAVGLPHRE